LVALPTIRPEKPRVRASDFGEWVNQNNAQRQAMDTFSNALARTGFGTPSMLESTQYPLTRLTKLYWLLQSLYRNHWLVRKIVDARAEDMVKNWVKLVTEIPPQALSRFSKTIGDTGTENQLLTTLKWGRLFGGAGAVIVIDGDEDRLDEPLDADDVMPGTYRGLVPFDRWAGISPNAEVNTNLGDPLSYGLPISYKVVTETAQSFDIHSSRVVRFIGGDLPNWEKQAEQRWGISIVEVFYEELRKRDNTSWNVANLVFRANLIGYKQQNLSQMLSGLGASQQVQARWHATMEAVNQTMSNQGMLILGKDDGLETHPYSFSGLAEVYTHVKEDICAAADYPYSRLFGKPSGGLGTTNEGDEHMYYDGIAQEQKTDLDPQLKKLVPIVAMSTWGRVPKDLTWIYNPVRSLGDKERIELASANTTSIVEVLNTGAISQRKMLEELKEQSDVTGVWTNITDDDIEAADDKPLMQQPTVLPGEEATGQAEDAALEPLTEIAEKVTLKNYDASHGPVRRTVFAGFPVAVETEVGEERKGPGWTVKMTCPYGYIEGTVGRDGDAVDCFLGVYPDAENVYVVHTKHPNTGEQDEDKAFLGFKSAPEALAAFLDNYSSPDFLHSFDVVPREQFRKKISLGGKIVADARNNL
jgi:phage-related protein (TIGR01555 family)